MDEDDEVFTVYCDIGDTRDSPFSLSGDGVTYLYNNKPNAAAIKNTYVTPDRALSVNGYHSLDESLEAAYFTLNLQLTPETKMTLREIKTIILKAKIIEASKNGRG